MTALKRISALFAASLLGFLWADLANAANQAPSAQLTAPAGGAQYDPPATISLAATASDSDGTVLRVEFFNGTTKLGEDTTAPYTFSWTSVPPGSYSLSARAWDNGGKSGTSSTVQVLVLSTVISSPAAGASIFGTSVAVTGSYTGADSTVVIITSSAGHSVIANSSGGSFSGTVGLAAGANTIDVQVARRDGTSEAISRSVTAVEPPVAVMTGPTSFGPYNVSTEVTLAADAASLHSTIRNVQFYKGAIGVGPPITSPPYTQSYTLDTVGNHIIFARATDNNDVSADSPTLTIAAVAPPPSVTMISPTTGSSFNAPANITLSATAAAGVPSGSVTKVEYFRDAGIYIGEQSVAPYTFTWSNVAAGSYVLRARVTDSFGTSAFSQDVSISVADNTPPIVSLTSPTGTLSLRAPATVNMTATASDADGIEKVEFLLNGQVEDTDLSSPYSSTRSGLGTGTYTVRARAIDTRGASTTSATSATVVVTANALPTVAITSPTANASFDAPTNVNIVASAADSDGTIASVHFFANGSVALGSTSSSPYQVTWENAPLGVHTLTAVVTDNDGATQTSAPVNIVVNGISAAITSPASGATYLVGTAFQIAGSISTSSGSVTVIELYDNGVLAQTLTPPAGAASVLPTFNLTASLPGAHAYTIMGYDSGGRTATSMAVNIAIRSAPSVALSLAHTRSDFIAPANITLRADATTAEPISRVDFFNGPSLLGSASAPPYEFTWINAPSGAFTLSARAVTPEGDMGPAQLKDVSVLAAPTLSVDLGIAGSIVAAENILFTGSAVVGLNGSVSVNGHHASIAPDGRFFINDLQLAMGANSLAVDVKGADGQTTSQTISVTRDGTANVGVRVVPDVGFAPLNVRFEVTPSEGLVFGTVEFDFGDDGSAEFIATNLGQAQAAMNDLPVGLHRVRVTTKTSAGAVVHSSLKMILASDPAQRFRQSKAIFDGMVGRLIAGDISGAVGGISITGRESWRAFFTALGPQLAARATSIGTPVRGTVLDDMTILELVRSEEGLLHIYSAYLIRDGDGVWRIDDM